jgi:hypothetical protein
VTTSLSLAVDFTGVAEDWFNKKAKWNQLTADRSHKHTTQAYHKHTSLTSMPQCLGVSTTRVAMFPYRNRDPSQSDTVAAATVSATVSGPSESDTVTALNRIQLLLRLYPDHLNPTVAAATVSGPSESDHLNRIQSLPRALNPSR